DSSHGAVVPRPSVKFVYEVQRALCVRRTFHVHPHKTFQGCCFRDQPTHQFARQALIYIEAHMREFETDVRIQALAGDRIQQSVIESSAPPGLFYIGYILPQVIDGDTLPKLIDGPRRAQNVVGLCSGYKTAGETLTER